MIFAARNEKDELTCDLVLSGDKIVTRRPGVGRIYKVGKDYAVQRGRGKCSEGRIQILSRIYHYEWVQKTLKDLSADEINQVLQEEAEREGFKSWKGLLDYLAKNNTDINNVIRYEFKVI